MYIVIMAGGGGTRLWPLSRPDRPKPFLPLLGDETLFQRTVRRVGSLVGGDDIYCVADRRYGHLVQEQAPEVRLIVEPSARNTAAAIALATVSIDRAADEVMAVLPADHWIEDEDGFRATLRAAHDLANGALGLEQPLVTLGVQVDRPATEYGYLIPDLDRRQRGDMTAYVLKAFEEKPDAARAAQLLNEPGVAWNAGMFLWQRGAIEAALEKYTPLMMLLGQAVGSELALAGAYERITPVSIDRAVMEGAARDHHVVMGAMDVGWSDLGSWTALLAALGIPGIDARVMPPGESADTTAQDLVVERRGDRVTATPAGDGTMTADATMAVLKGARPFEAQVGALLTRSGGA